MYLWLAITIVILVVGGILNQFSPYADLGYLCFVVSIVAGGVFLKMAYDKAGPVWQAAFWVLLGIGLLVAAFMIRPTVFTRSVVLYGVPSIIFLVGLLKLWAAWVPNPLVQKDLIPGTKQHDTLFVLVHGLSNSPIPGSWVHPEKCWDGVVPDLGKHGDVLVVRYPSFAASNADPLEIARGIGQEVEKIDAANKYTEIVLVGYSLGAPLVRKAYFEERSRSTTAASAGSWATKVHRIVLLAGMNRGWDISGHQPMDMDGERHTRYWFGSWLAQATNTGRLVRSVEAGAPFVANLRMEWMRLFGDGYDLRLMSWVNEVSGLPRKGKNLIVVAAVRNVLHFRIFDSDGETVVDTDENRLTGKVPQIKALKEQLESLWPPHEITRNEKDRITAGVASIVGRTPGQPYVVQLLGDIDDVVSDEDNKDLRASLGKYIWIKVRGTGHNDVVDFNDPERYNNQSLGDYRKEKFLSALRTSIDTLQRENEEQRFGTDDDVTHIVFVVHGIRDLGRWSTAFESALKVSFSEELKKRPQPCNDKLHIAAIRYGYFGLGPFLLMSDRQKYVRWLMDEYTETLARYPKAKRIDFVGHSNGTYLLASALEQYTSLKVNRIVFAASVARRNYDWGKAFKRKQVEQVRNYVAYDDWPVALFARFFEFPLVRWLGNDIGSAGFNGFDDPNNPKFKEDVQNVQYISGQHAAFLDHIPSITDILIPPAPGKAAPPNTVSGRRWGFLKFVSDYFCWAVWLVLAFVVIGGGFHVVGAAREYAIIVAAVYIGIVLWILHQF
jgi:pimeloyl-ACP methyl ester carboxylesterase